MKKRAAKVTAFCIAAGFTIGGNSTIFMAEPDSTPTYGFAKCPEYVNIRAAGDTESEVVGLIKNNGYMQILDEDENGWYHIKSGNVEGYIASQYVATGNEADEIAQSAGYTTAEVGAEYLNVRSEKSEDAKVVDTAAENDELEVVDDEGDWVKVVTDEGVYGWVSSDYVYVSTEYAQAMTIGEYEASQSSAAASSDNSYNEEAQAAADAAQAQADEAAQAQADAQA